MRARPDPSQITEVYIDESSQTNHRFLVLGCVCVDLTDSEGLKELIAAARLPELPQGEAKWVKVSQTKLAAYRRLVDVLFDNKAMVHFHSLVVDTTKLDHRRFNKGDREIGFNKEIYQLAMKCGRLYRDRVFHVYPDERYTTQSPNELRNILNSGCKKKGDKRDFPFRRCQFRDSAQTHALQLTDIVTGALAYRLNGHAAKEGASPAKIALSQYVLDRAGIRDVGRDSAIGGLFTLWHRQLK